MTARWLYSIRCIFAGFLLVTVLTAAGQPSAFTASSVQRIEITPVWSDEAGSTATTVVIQKDHGAFTRSFNPMALAVEKNVLQIVSDQKITSEHNDKTNSMKNAFISDEIETDRIEHLLDAFHAPPLLRPTLANLGITPFWLAHFASDNASYVGNLGERNTDSQKDFARKAFADSALVKRLLPQVVDGSWTDDAAWVQIRVIFENGIIWSAQSNHQPAFMLPWSCNLNGAMYKTYNADISRAISALLPENSVNRRRLSGVGLDEQLRMVMSSAIKKQWQEIGAEDLAGASLNLLKKNYDVRSSEVSSHIGLTYGPYKLNDSPSSIFLKADVRKSNFPKGLVVATIFPVVDGKPTGVDGFLRNGSYYEEMILSTHWLMKSLRRFPDVGAWLYFVKDTSMSEKAYQVFAKDMHELGRDDLAREVLVHRQEVALLNYNGNHLIVFPDHHAIIWRWGKWRELFRWPAGSLITSHCQDYPTSTEGCVAAIIQPSGELMQ